MEKIILNGTSIQISKCEVKQINGNTEVTVKFPVTHEDYHDITSLLYEEEFIIEVPAKKLSMKGRIEQYYTSITNLYQPGNVAEFSLTLVGV